MWSIVAAAAYPNRVIGRSGRLPWHLPLELRLFRSLTWGGILIMGRHTWESIGRPLQGREIWVLSRTLASHQSVKLFPEPESLLKALRLEDRPAFFVGGERLYRWALTLPEVNRLFLTWVFMHVEGDKVFPDLSEAEWRVTGWELFYEACIPFIRVEYLRFSTR
ncbi:MAG: dihydrofolate reductase [Bacteroidia bacterium]|nr:dihydrofolate reductase [Bacteroidia bacterium]